MSQAPQKVRRMGSESISVEFSPSHLALLGLTPRQCEVMQWISEGKRDREIATILSLSPRTVEKHVCNIFEKLKVETRIGAVNQCRFSLARYRTRGGETARARFKTEAVIRRP